MDLSDSITQTVEALEKSLVSIDARRAYPLTGVIWKDDIVVTTNRAVERTEKIHVELPGGESVIAELIGRAPRIDLAALHVKDAELSPATWIKSDDLKVGQLMLRLAKPRGSIRVTMGVLGGLEPWRSRSGTKLDTRIITDAGTFRGFSGGALATLAGEVVGINTAALSRTGDSVIPTSNIERTMHELLEHGRVRQGYLGISGQPVRLPGALQEQLEQRAGMLVMSVESGSPAEKAGLNLGDVIVSLNGVKVARPGSIMSQLSGEQIGELLPLVIARGGDLQTLDLVVEERAQDS